MAEAALPRHLFLTGRLAEAALHRVLGALPEPGFTWEIRQIGVQVAALMTAELIRRRVAAPVAADKMIVPGRCRGDLDALSAHFGIPVIRGPDELKDIPAWLGGKARAADLSRYAVRIFAEIVEAPQLDVAGIVARAAAYRADGADVIDLGCLPATPFPHLAESVQELKRLAFTVSVDSLELDDLRVGGTAGADYLLSLTEDSIALADEVASVPIVIPREPRDYEGFKHWVKKLVARGRPFIADPILEPIHFGFTDSMLRYHRLRRDFPEVEILMGIGNLTELTDADTSGTNALLAGIMSELDINALLTTQVSAHARSAVREIDRARRIMFAAKSDNDLPKGYSTDLLVHHDKNPFPDSPGEIREVARQVRDPSYRIQVSAEGIHVYNRDGLHTAADPFALFPSLGVENDGGHAFYLGVELARAQVAWELGKRYVQDEPLAWGCAVPRTAEDLERYREAGTTLEARHGVQPPPLQGEGRGGDGGPAAATTDR